MLEDKIVVRVGGSTPIHTEVRILAATNQDLGAMVRAKKFREDLFFRLNVVSLELPPLRERGEDVLLLAESLPAELLPQRWAARRPSSPPRRKKRLLAHAWPGNVRELRNLTERLAYLTPATRSKPEDLVLIDSGGDDADAARAGRLAGRSDARLPAALHPQDDRRRPRQHERRRPPAGPAPLEPLPQDAATRHGDRRRQADEEEEE